MITTIIVNAIRMGTIFLFGCIGEILTEKAGNLNLGIPGIMCIGATGGGLAVTLYAGNVENVNSFVLVLLSVLLSMIFAGLAGLLYSFLTVSLNANQNVTGLTMTTFGVGFMKFFSKRIYDQKLYVSVSGCFKNLFGEMDGDNVFSQIFLSHGVLVYLSIIIAVCTGLFLKKTKYGLYLRAVGESPATADAAGISVKKYKYLFITLGSAVAGLGGLYYIMDRSSGTQFAEAAIDSFGWLSVALVIASVWKPLFAIVGSFIFGGLSILDAQLKTLSLAQQKLFAIVPFLITVVVLIAVSMLKLKDNQPPASLGLPYFREDR